MGADLAKGAKRFDERSKSSDGKSAGAKQKTKPKGCSAFFGRPGCVRVTDAPATAWRAKFL